MNDAEYFIYKITYALKLDKQVISMWPFVDTSTLNRREVYYDLIKKEIQETMEWNLLEALYRGI